MMVLAIILFWILVPPCSRICRMPKPPGTKRNNAKHQERADNCRNMQTANARRNKSPKLRSRICKLQNAISCNKRPSSNTGAAVLAPLGAFGSGVCRSPGEDPTRLGTPLCETGAADLNAPSGASTAAPYFVSRRLVRLIAFCKFTFCYFLDSS